MVIANYICTSVQAIVLGEYEVVIDGHRATLGTFVPDQTLQARWLKMFADRQQMRMRNEIREYVAAHHPCAICEYPAPPGYDCLAHRRQCYRPGCVTVRYGQLYCAECLRERGATWPPTWVPQ